jgi:hypothetical protein
MLNDVMLVAAAAPPNRKTKGCPATVEPANGSRTVAPESANLINHMFPAPLDAVKDVFNGKFAEVVFPATQTLPLGSIEI